MKVLVTGAAGFLGQHFTQWHLDQNDDVLAIDNFSNANTAKPKFAFQDVDAGYWFQTMLKKSPAFDRAYHFAAPVGGRMKIEQDPFYNADSLRLDTGFFAWAAKYVKLAIYPSSSAVYPITSQRTTRHIALSEDLVHPKSFMWHQPDEMYGFTKFVGEFLAHKAANYGLNTLCIRPFSGYGEGQSLEYPMPSIVRRALTINDPLKVWGSGTQTRDFIHVSDIVAGTLARIDQGVEGYQSMNLGTGTATSFNQVARLAADLVGYKPTIENDDTKPQGVQNRYADIKLMETYYQPKVSLPEGIRRVMEWMDAAQDR